MNSAAVAWQFRAMITATHTSTISAPAGDAPEWLQLIPAGTFSGVDGRGPYVNDAPAAVVALFNREARKLPIDENHSIDLMGPKGQATPARGWVTELEARADGIWGKVDWTDEGRQLVAGHSYGFLSPVFLHAAAKPFKVAKLVRAALTNDPNLTNLKSLHAKEDTAMLEQLRKALGLPETATEAEVTAAVTAMHTAQTAQAALMSKIATAVGVVGDVTGDALVTALQTKIAAPVTATKEASTEIDTLKGQLTAMQNQLTSYVSVTSKDKATSVIEKAIVDGKLIPALKDHYIARHMKDAAEVEKEIALLPSLHAGGLGGKLPPKVGEGAAPDDDEMKVAALMGIDLKSYAETHKAIYGKATV